MINLNGFTSQRSLTSEELAKLIIDAREQRGWSQETLAEIARISIRTVQRLEKALSCDRHTKRALAKALDWEDIDAFNKEWPFPNVEKIKENEKQLNENYFKIALESDLSGYQLRSLIDRAEALSVDEITELSSDVCIIFSELFDYIKDYLDIKNELSWVDKKAVEKDFQIALDKLKHEGTKIGVGIKQSNFKNDNFEKIDATSLCLAHIVIGTSKSFPEYVFVPKDKSLD